MLALELERLGRIPVRLGLEHAHCVLHTLTVALLEPREDQKRRIDLAGADHVVELQAVSLELCDVAGEEVAALAVEEVEVALEHLLGQLVVDRHAAVVSFLEDPADLAGRRTMRVRRGDGARWQYRGARRRLYGACERKHEDRKDGGSQPTGGAAQVLRHRVGTRKFGTLWTQG